MLRTISYIAAVLAVAAAPALAGSNTPAEVEPSLVPATSSQSSSPDWTGFYAGGQLGYGDVNSNAALNGGDAIGGFTAGYDYDLGQWVVGGGLDYDFADIGLGAGTSLDSIWRAKLRGGYKIGDGLLYGTAGYANADTNTLGSDDGYFVGAGYEHLISSNFGVGGEVLYHEFNNFNGTATDIEATTYQVRATFRF